MEPKPDFRIVDQILASLGGEDRDAALRILQREAVKEASEILNGGKSVSEERPQKDSGRAFDRNLI